MTCAPCNYAGNRWAKPVELVAGGQACTWCEAWRAECADRHREAQTVLRLSDRADRIAWLDNVEATRGKLARDRLAAEVMRQWEARRAARAVHETA